MTRTLSSLAVLTAFAAALFAAPAYANMDDKDHEKKFEKMKSELLLTDEQSDSVKTIVDDYKERMKALKQEKHDRIDAVLTPEQRTKHEEMKKEWKDRKEADDKD